MSALAAVLPVFVGGRQIDTLQPEKRFYKKPKQPTTEVANRSTLREDLYVVLGSYDPKTQLVTIQAYVNPLVVWIWLGGLILALGTSVAVWPTAAEREVRVVAARRRRGPPPSERSLRAAARAAAGAARSRRARRPPRHRHSRRSRKRSPASAGAGSPSTPAITSTAARASR